MIFTQMIIIIISNINYIDSVSSDKQDTHEDDKCKILLMSPISCII